MKKSELLSALIPVVYAFEKHAIPYYISGSIASSVYGTARTTMDVDIVADVKTHHILLLKKELEELYYFDEEMITEAIQNSSCFNLIHFETSIKIDVFIFKREPYHQRVLDRKVKDTLDDDEKTEVYLLTPEDTILSKLQWYLGGGKISERQWLDIVGVLKVQGDSLDKNYLQEWAKKLGIFELLTEAFEDAGLPL